MMSKSGYSQTANKTTQKQVLANHFARYSASDAVVRHETSRNRLLHQEQPKTKISKAKQRNSPKGQTKRAELSPSSHDLIKRITTGRLAYFNVATVCAWDK